MRWLATLLLAACAEGSTPDASDAGALDADEADTGSADRRTNDRTPPTVQAVSPADGAAGVPLNVFISASFSESIDCRSVSATTMMLVPATAGEISCAGDTITFDPTDNLTVSTQYTVMIGAGVRDLSANALATDYGWTFTAGDVIDDTPPVRPEVTDQIPQTTMQDSLTLMGTKEANASVRARWQLDGATQHGFTEIVPLDGTTGWSHVFPMMEGVNRYTLLSDDAAGNSSATFNFIVTRPPVQLPVTPPTVDFFPTTRAPQLVLSGTKESGHGIALDGNVVVPRDSLTTWDHEITLSPGLNSLQIRSIDAQGARSDPPVYVDIDHVVPPLVPAAADLAIELELRDMWNLVGDEFRITNCDVEIDHFAVEIWIEGPLPYLDNGTPADPSDDRYERCYFDDVQLERKHTRYLANVHHQREGNVSELWVHPSYLVPNLEAALIENGHWAATGQPIAPDADRRDGSGARSYSTSALQLAPPLDGITAASIRPVFDRNTGTSTPGVTLGTWATRPRFYWNLVDRNGTRIREGAYLINVAVVLDRSAPEQGAGGQTDLGQPAVAPYQWDDVQGLDRETCWDRPAHDSVGQHRAEGIMILDGNAKTVFWSEKGRSESVDAAHNERAGIRFDGRCDWDGIGPDATCDPMSIADDFTSAPHCPAPNTSVGAPVRYLNTPGGWSAPVRVEYCPAGCP